MKLFLQANWEHIIMANYSVPPEVLIPFLPKGLTLDLFDGKAYVSLVGFMFKNTKIFRVPIPFMGTFEEINLRFYVVRKEKDIVKRGVVFINETIPYRFVAWVANTLYKEHYTVVPTRHQITKINDLINVKFEWFLENKKNSISVSCGTTTKPLPEGSLEQFIYEHYYGYTKLSDATTDEYKICHPSWKTYKVENFEINCDFASMYSSSFAFLNNQAPDAVFMAEGSSIGVEWKRNRLKL